MKGNKQQFNVTVNGSNYDNISVEEAKSTAIICVDDDSSFVIAHRDGNKTNSYAFRNVCADIEIPEFNQSIAKQILKSVGKGCFIRLASDSEILSEIIIESCFADQTVTAESRNHEENVCINDGY